MGALEVIAGTLWFDDDHEGSEYEREVGDSLARSIIERLEAAGYAVTPVAADGQSGDEK